MQQSPRNYSVSFRDSHLFLRVSVSSVGTTHAFPWPLVPDYCFLLALTHQMDHDLRLSCTSQGPMTFSLALISIFQACPCSTQWLLMQEKDAVAMGTLEWWFLPSMVTSPFGNLMKTRDIFCPRKLHIYTEPQYSYAITGVGQSLPQSPLMELM